MSTTFSDAARLATLHLGEQTVDGTSITVSEGATAGQFILTANTSTKGSNLAFRPNSNVHTASSYEAYTDEGSTDDTTTYKETQWNISVNGDANNSFHFYRTTDTDSPFRTDKGGPDSVSFGAGDDSVLGISVATDGTTVNGGDGNNEYHYDDPTYDYSGDSVGQHPGGYADYFSSANRGEAARNVTIVDGKGASYAEVTGTWTAQMGLGADTVAVVTEGQEGEFDWTDYDASEGDVLQVSKSALDVSNLSSLESNLAADGTVHLARNTDGTSAIQAVLNTAGKSNYRVKIQNPVENGEPVAVDAWYAGTKASVLDAEAMDTPVVMISNNNENEGDSLRGGAKGDILIGGMNDTLNGGVGDDTLYLGTSNTVDSIDYQRETVVLDTRGDKDIVFNFGTGYADTSDVLHVAQGSPSIKNITSNGTDIVATATDNSSVTLAEVGQNQTTHMQDILISNGDAIKKAAVVQSNQTGYVDDSDKYDAYFGSDSTLNFDKSTGVDYNLAVDLGNTGRFGAHSYYNGIVAVYGMNADNNTLVGAAGANNTLAAGANSYNNSIWGGGLGRDYMIADEGAADTFFYGEGDDQDTVVGFNVGEDRLFVHSGKVVSTTRSSATSDVIRFTWNDNNVFTVVANDKKADTALTYTLNGEDNRGIKVGISDVANTFTYEEGVDAYFGGIMGDTLNVATAENKSFWMDGRTGDINTKGIETLNASASTGNLQLAGDAASNHIVGGAGQNSIWGGDGNVSDELSGGTGKNSFYFGKGEGNDIISSYNDGDRVMLYNVATSGISSAALSGEDMVITLTDGSKLTVQNYSSNGSMSFQLTDATYLYDKDKNVWAKQD